MNKDTSKATILVISMGLLVLHLTFSWKWAVYLSLAIGLVGIVSPSLSGKIEWGWMKLANMLGYITSKILLSIVFFLFLFPMSIISKLFTKDLLMLSREYGSYFVDVNKEIDKESFEKLW